VLGESGEVVVVPTRGQDGGVPCGHLMTTFPLESPADHGRPGLRLTVGDQLVDEPHEFLGESDGDLTANRLTVESSGMRRGMKPRLVSPAGSARTLREALFACDSIAVPAWSRTWFRVKTVISWAKASVRVGLE
jgi:hypothetical protein